MSLPGEVVARLSESFESARSPERAVPMKAYMRDQFDYFGIAAPEQRRLARAALAGLPAPAERDVKAVAKACWDRTEREFQYFACDYIERYIDRCTPAFITTLERLITTKSWWDTVDGLCRNGAGPLVLAHPELVDVMDRWLVSDNIWLARSAILHQGRWKGRTDRERLFRYCLTRGGDTEFFIRKAIGWALRDYAHVDAPAVRRFLAEHDAELSGLSKREALKRVRD